MLIRARVHPFPFRTRKLSSLLPKILVWRRTGTIGNANTNRTTEWLSCFAIYVSEKGQVMIQKLRSVHNPVGLRTLKTAVAVCLLYVSIDLFSRSVARQVFSALQSLTSVFGMGTGGPSALETPTEIPFGIPLVRGRKEKQK